MGKGNLRLKYEVIFKVAQDIFTLVPSLSDLFCPDEVPLGDEKLRCLTFMVVFSYVSLIIFNKLLL